MADWQAGLCSYSQGCQRNRTRLLDFYISPYPLMNILVSINRYHHKKLGHYERYHYPEDMGSSPQNRARMQNQSLLIATASLRGSNTPKS